VKTGINPNECRIVSVKTSMKMVAAMSEVNENNHKNRFLKKRNMFKAN